MKKIITLAFLAISSIVYAVDAPFPELINPRSQVKAGETFIVCDAAPDSILGPVEAFHKAIGKNCDEVGYTAKSVLAKYETGVAEFKINEKAVQDFVLKAINVDGLRLNNLSRYFYLTKTGREFYLAQNDSTKAKIAILFGDSSLYFGMGNKWAISDPQYKDFALAPAFGKEILSSKAIATYFWNTSVYNYKRLGVLDRCAEFGISENELKLAIFKANNGLGITSEKWQKFFIENLGLFSTKADKLAKIEKEIYALVTIVNPENENQTKWLTKLRLLKTVYSE